MTSISIGSPPRRALIVVDAQNDYDGGALAIRHPPICDSLANVARAMDAAATAGVGIVVVEQVAAAVDTVTVAGYMTHNCVLSTIIHALHMGFAVEFLSDAAGSIPYLNSAGYASAADIHRVVNVVLQSRFAAVLETAEWIDRLETGALPERDDIYASYRRALAHEAG